MGRNVFYQPRPEKAHLKLDFQDPNPPRYPTHLTHKKLKPDLFASIIQMKGFLRARKVESKLRQQKDYEFYQYIQSQSLFSIVCLD